MSAEIIHLAKHRRVRLERRPRASIDQIIWPLAIVGCLAFYAFAAYGAVALYRLLESGASLPPR